LRVFARVDGDEGVACCDIVAREDASDTPRYARSALAARARFR
jgi:hypothetical protein